MADMNKPLLEVKNLKTFFKTRNGIVKAVNDVSYSIYPGKTLGIVGESGSGKSVSAMSVLRLLDANGYIAGGTVTFDGQDLSKVTTEQMYHIRGNRISVIFQEPMTSLNPVFSVKKQLSEPFIIHQGMSKKEAAAKCIEMLRAVQIPNPEAVAKQYPHQLSGGMRQRVMIAMALACKPDILIADEPTTALDVTIQAQILRLMNDRQKENGTAIMFITHDLGVIAEMADYVVVMYAGRIVEQGTVDEIFSHPAHPYTIGLMASKPIVGKKVDRLYSIPGKVPNPVDMPDYCYFKDRCEMCVERCSGEYPGEVSISPTHKVSCYRYYDGQRPDLEEQVEQEMTGSADNGKEGK